MRAPAVPGPGDLRRLLVRFVWLVVVPVVGLVAFGVLAISNERAAVERRFAQEYSSRLRPLASHLAQLLETYASKLERDAPPELGAEVRFAFQLDSEGIFTDRPVDAALVAQLEQAFAPGRAETSSEAIALVPVATGPAHGLYAIRRVTGGLRGMAFDEVVLSHRVEREARRRFPNEPARFELIGPAANNRPRPDGLRGFLDQLARSSTRPDSDPLSLPLPAPLEEWRISARLPSDDPVASALLRNRLLYATALAFFYAIIATGVVLTLRGLSREMRLSRLKTDFVSNISHELRTPLTSIRLFAETLKLGRARTDEERAACIDYIHRESTRLSRLAERTLDWSRLEAGRRAFEMRALRLDALVEHWVEQFLSHGTVAREAVGIDHVWRALGAPAPVVEGDAEALEMVVSNLLENAAKYSPGSPRITVVLRTSGHNVLLDVRDAGIGISRADQRRIFERFYRADDLLARRTEGTGLGLAISRRVVEAHGGRITVKSRPAEGSTFTVDLPLSNRIPDARHMRAMTETGEPS